MHCQRGCRPLLTFTPHDHTRTHNKHEPISGKIYPPPPPLSSSCRYQLPHPALSPPLCPGPTTQTLLSLSPWIDSVGCGCILRAKIDSPTPPPPPLPLPPLPAVIPKPEPHQPAQQPWLPAVSPAAPTGEEAARGPGGRPLLYQHPLMWPASRFLSGEFSVKSHLEAPTCKRTLLKVSDLQT